MTMNRNEWELNHVLIISRSRSNISSLLMLTDTAVCHGHRLQLSLDYKWRTNKLQELGHQASTWKVVSVRIPAFSGATVQNFQFIPYHRDAALSHRPVDEEPLPLLACIKQSVTHALAQSSSFSFFPVEAWIKCSHYLQYMSLARFHGEDCFYGSSSHYFHCLFALVLKHVVMSFPFLMNFFFL